MTKYFYIDNTGKENQKKYLNDGDTLTIKGQFSNVYHKADVILSFIFNKDTMGYLITEGYVLEEIQKDSPQTALEAIAKILNIDSQNAKTLLKELSINFPSSVLSMMNTVNTDCSLDGFIAFLNEPVEK